MLHLNQLEMALLDAILDLFTTQCSATHLALSSYATLHIRPISGFIVNKRKFSSSGTIPGSATHRPKNCPRTGKLVLFGNGICSSVTGGSRENIHINLVNIKTQAKGLILPLRIHQQ